jgi:hypothetical protein
MTALGDNPFEDDSRPDVEVIDGMELLNTIRQQARPSWSPEIDRLCMDATRNGWTIDTLARAVSADIGAGAGPGVAMMLLRRLCKNPPPKARIVTGAEAAIIGHAPCNLPQHGPTCQICHCARGREQHIIVTPMPDWFKTEMAAMKNFGVIPDA